jgi:retron-type reverse transcriptase
MKRVNNLWDKVCTKENIELAWNRTRKGKSRYAEVQDINLHKEYYLSQLLDMLRHENYSFTEPRTRKIYEPKERTIFIVPVFPDRILHHCVMNVVSPIWESMMYGYSFACRKNKGYHAASNYVCEAMRKTKFYMKGDIKKYYPSINHDILKSIIRRKIKDRRVLTFFDRLIDSINSDTDIPIGHYTSQWVGNLYLNELDTFVKHTLGYRHYVRYMDDFMLFENDKKKLQYDLKRIRNFLSSELKLKLSKEGVYPNCTGLNAFGYRHIKRSDNGQVYVLLRPSSRRRVRKHILRDIAYFNHGKLPLVNFYRKIIANNGVLNHAKTKGFKSQFLFEDMFRYARDGLGREEEMKHIGELINLRVRDHLHGQQTPINDILNKNILLTDVKFTKNKYAENNSNGVENLAIFQYSIVEGLSEKTAQVSSTARVTFSGGKDIYESLKSVSEAGLPKEGVLLRIVKKGKAFMVDNPVFENDTTREIPINNEKHPGEYPVR